MAATQVASPGLKLSSFQGLRVGSPKYSDSGVDSLRLVPHGVEERSASLAIQAVATVSTLNSARTRSEVSVAHANDFLRTSKFAAREYVPTKARVFSKNELTV